jgi:hypothetical protein
LQRANEQWPKVEAVAQVLFEKKTLTEDDLLNIMGQLADKAKAA